MCVCVLIQSANKTLAAAVHLLRGHRNGLHVSAVRGLPPRSEEAVEPLRDSSGTLVKTQELKRLMHVVTLTHQAVFGIKIIKKTKRTLQPAELRMEILRMEYLRWVESDDVIIFVLSRDPAEAKVTFRVKSSFVIENEKKQKQNTGNATLIQLFK